MPYASHRFIDPRALAAIADLQLVARAVVEGFMFGSHESRMVGAGLEFSQYRSYQPGDDIRRVDWKLFARSDRYYVREAEAEMSLTVRFVLDASESMASDEGEGISKFDYARFLVASLGFLANGQGDQIGLHALRYGGVESTPAGRDRQALHRFLSALERVGPAGVWPPWDVVEGTFAAAPRRELVVVVTDLHERATEITTALAKLAALRNEVIVLHVMSRSELAFDYGGAVRFEELETGRMIEVDTDRLRDRYLAHLDRDLRDLRHRLHNQRIGYALMQTDQPLDYALRAFLTRRMHLL